MFHVHVLGIVGAWLRSSFCVHIRCHIFDWKVLHFYFLSFNYISNEVIAEIDVFGSSMKDWVSSHVARLLIIIVNHC